MLYLQYLLNKCIDNSEPVIITFTGGGMWCSFLLSIIFVSTDREGHCAPLQSVILISPSQQSAANSYTETLHNFPEVTFAISAQLIKATL